MSKESLSDETLARLLAASYERLPDAEFARLDAIEARLMRALPRTSASRRVPGWYWWLLAAFVATASAAWWAGDYFFGAASLRQSAERSVPTVPQNSEPAPTKTAPQEEPSTAPPDK